MSILHRTARFKVKPGHAEGRVPHEVDDELVRRRQLRADSLPYGVTNLVEALDGSVDGSDSSKRKDLASFVRN